MTNISNREYSMLKNKNPNIPESLTQRLLELYVRSRNEGYSVHLSNAFVRVCPRLKVITIT